MTDAEFPGTPGRGMMPDWYGRLLDDVSAQVSTGHRRALRAANAELLTSYWEVGNAVLKRQSGEGWGSSVIERLSADLKVKFPEARGFSPRNLRYMKTFAELWQREAILQQPVAELPWGHHLQLLKLDRSELRLWYAERALAEGWSRNILALQIETRMHERDGCAITNFAEVLPAADSDLAQQMIFSPVSTMSRPSACCCARPRTMPSRNTRCARTRHRLVWPSGRPS